MQPYIEINAHHIGKSHVLNGLDCEDYSEVYSDEQLSIVVISDGHGDKNCFRSALGAMHACDVAIRELRRFQSVTNHIDDLSQCDFESLVVSLESDIANRWKEKVLRDAELNPFTAEELDAASERAREVYGAGDRFEKAYGCTLIAAIVTGSYWLAIQIGDGKCVAAYNDGVFVEPVPVDENCLGNRSTSLCNSNAIESFRHYYSNVKPLAVFVSSDGIEESFDQAGLYNCFYSVGYWLKENGLEATREKLDDLLPQISEGGSGDDVSIAAMTSQKSLLAKPRQSLQQVYEKVSSCSDALEQCTAQLADAQAKLAGLEEQYDSIEMEIVELKEKLAEKEELFNAVAKEKEAIDADVDELSEREHMATEQMEKAESFKASAENFWFPRLEKIGLEFKPEIDGEPLNDDENDVGDEENLEKIEGGPVEAPADAPGNEEAEELLAAAGSGDCLTDNTRDSSGIVDGDELTLDVRPSVSDDVLQTNPNIEEPEKPAAIEATSTLRLPEITADDFARSQHLDSATSYSDALRDTPRKTEFSDLPIAPADENQPHVERSERRRWPFASRSRQRGGEAQ